jgi:hypothetical protein
VDCPNGCTVPQSDTPRQIEDDHHSVCRRCTGVTRDALVRLPDLVEHIRAHVVPGSAGPTDAIRVRSSKTAPAPLSLAAVDDADRLHAVIAQACGAVMAGRDVRGPSWHGTRLLAASKRTKVPGQHAAGCKAGPRCPGCAPVYDEPRPLGLSSAALDVVALSGLSVDRADPARTWSCICLLAGAHGPHTRACWTRWRRVERYTPDTQPSPAAELVAWLDPHLDWVYAQDWAADFVTAITTAVGQVGARWAVEERPQHLNAPCPACNRLTLSRYAPTFYTGEPSIRCSARDCGEPIPIERYGLYTRVVVAGLTFDDPIAGHLYALEDAGAKPARRYVARRTLRALAAWLDHEDRPQRVPLTAATTLDVQAWLDDYGHPAPDDDRRLAVLEDRLAAVRGFYAWALAHDVVADDPTVGVAVRTLSVEEIGGAA